MRFGPGFAYRMPVAFGPLPGPRQMLPGDPARGGEASVTTRTLRFRSDAGALAELLPPGLDPAGEPLVTVEYTELRDVPWLAGRGYDTFAVKLPARFDGRRDHVTGSFVAVVWENMADPIITGREELGYAKLFADLSSVPEGPDGHRCTASWDGHVFAELEFSRMTEVEPEPVVPGDDGTLNYGYVPGVDAGPDRSGPVLTPAAGQVDVDGQATATGRVRFVPSTWEQLPTFHPIVGTLAELPVLEYHDAVVRRTRRNVENRGQRSLV